jgi:hypothetical protein
MKIKDIAVGGRFLARLMLGANVFVLAEYKRGTANRLRPGYYDCKLLTVEIQDNGLTVTQKSVTDEGLTMYGETDVYHEELVI